MKPVAEIPELRLAHYTKIESTGSGIRTTWVVWPLQLQRPQQGVANVQVSCPTCHRTVELTVSSSDVARSERLNWHLLMYSLYALSLMVLILSFVVDNSKFGPPWIGGSLILVPPIIALNMTGFVRGKNGVRLTKAKTIAHSIKDTRYVRSRSGRR